MPLSAHDLDHRLADADRLAACFAERAAVHDRDGSFPHESIADLQASGWPGLVVPVDFGGAWRCNAMPRIRRASRPIHTGGPQSRPTPHTARRAMQIYDADTSDLLRSQYRDPLLRHLTRTIVALVRRYGPDPARVRVIDIGCGVGRTSLALARGGYPVVGVDPSERAVEVARSEAQATVPEVKTEDAEPQWTGRTAFHVGDASADAPVDWQGAFDIAVCSEVIEHVEVPERVIGYARSVLRPGGILILTTPHDRAQWTIMDDYAGHVTRFTPGEIEALLAGFDVLELATEGFPFQRLAMRAYDRLLARRGGQHAFDRFGNSPAYHVYTALMPYLLNIDHHLRGLKRGTTIVAVGQRR